MLLISEAIGDMEQISAAPPAKLRALPLRNYAGRTENSDV